MKVLLKRWLKTAANFASDCLPHNLTWLMNILLFSISLQKYLASSFHVTDYFFKCLCGVICSILSNELEPLVAASLK